MKARRFLAIVLASLTMASCERPASRVLQGYVEGEFVYVSPPSAGKLAKLHVERGRQVKTGELLFEIENTPEKAVRDEAAHRLAQSKSTLEDAKKGKRPTEIDSIQAQLKQAKEALALSEIELSRQEKLTKTGAVSVEAIDRARSTNVQNRQRVEQLEADLKTAQLGLRTDAVTALEADVKAREAALAKAEWDLSQKQQTAPQAGVVDDTLFREGEWVPAGRPVVSLLPPSNIKVRAFVPQTNLAALHVGDAANVFVDGNGAALPATVSFIAPQAEYTPPVIYSQENRSKLMFMIELKFADDVAAKLHPGQPVDVEL